eukprot:1183501-Prorocentrum_minimum.AAC.4
MGLLCCFSSADKVTTANPPPPPRHVPPPLRNVTPSEKRDEGLNNAIPERNEKAAVHVQPAPPELHEINIELPAAAPSPRPLRFDVPLAEPSLSKIFDIFFVDGAYLGRSYDRLDCFARTRYPELLMHPGSTLETVSKRAILSYANFRMCAHKVH